MSVNSRDSLIQEIESIDALERIEQNYALRFGHSAFNISHWDPSPEFERRMFENLEMPDFQTVISYRFSYQISEESVVIKKLGGDPTSHAALFTPSNSSSIVCVLNLVKELKGKVFVACPSYFSIFHACRRFGLPVVSLYLKRNESCFSIPWPTLTARKHPGVLWVTNPVYGAGVYHSSADLANLRNLLETGWVIICDECLTMPGHEMIRAFKPHKNFISIYSPHKGLCINGVKFSVILFHPHHRKFMEQWADVWYGGLGASSLIGVHHYLSPNFDSFLTWFTGEIDSYRQSVFTLCSNHEVKTDRTAKGHFISCYIPSLPYSWGSNLKFLADMVNKTGASLFPGNRSRFDPAVGFCFRVNLARKGPALIPSLARISQHLNSLKSV